MTKKILCIFALFCFLTTFYSYSFYSYFPIWNDTNLLETNSSDSNDFISLESESAILIEQTTGEILFEKNCHKKLRPASVTKIMSLILIMEALDRGDISLETQISCSEKASSMGGSQIWLDNKETLTVNDMLKAICIVSANDCTVAMAEHLAGSEELFVQKMNEKAKELGMSDTCFKNCHGIDEDGHLTSSYDIALMSRELLKNHPDIMNYTTIWMDSLRNGESELVNTNKLIKTYNGITGLKTGSTSLSLYNLSASATRKNLSLIAVVLRSPTPKVRFSEAKLLLDYGFNNFEFKSVSTQNDIAAQINISKGTKEHSNLLFESTNGILIKKNANSTEIIEELIINENLEAPIRKNEILGKINYYIDDSLKLSVNLIAEENIERNSLFNTFKYIVKNWITLFKV